MILVFALTACSDAEEPKPYSDFKDVFHPELVVNAGVRVDGTETLQVLVHPERAGVCRDLPKLQANVDGVALTRLHGRVTGEYTYDRDCLVYEFEGNDALIRALPKQADDVVTVTDGETTVSVTVHNLFGARTLVLQGKAVAGQDAVLKWSPGGDRLVPKVPVGLTFRSGGRTETVRDLKLSVDDVTFKVPDWLGPDATAEFIGTVGVQPTFTACTAFTCDASRTYTVPPVPLFPS